MINLDNFKLEQTLLDTYVEQYDGSISSYLVIENIKFFLDDYEENDSKPGYMYEVKLRYGIEDKECNHISLILNTEWSFETIKGYFIRVLEEEDEKSLRKSNEISKEVADFYLGLKG